MKRINLFLIFSLLCSIISPSYAALPSRERLTELKKSLVTHFNRFSTCIKGDKNCSQQEKIFSRTLLALLITLGLVIVGKSAYALKKFIEPIPAKKQEIKIIPKPKSVNEQLLEAAQKNDLDRVKQLINHDNADIDTYDPINGSTPLVLAISKNNEPMVTFLLQHGARINYQPSFDSPMYLANPPLHSATSLGRINMMKLLLKYKADINFQNIDGETPLYQAIRQIKNDAALLLIKNKADVTIPQINGITPLHIAAYNNNIEMALILIEKGAQINAKEKSSQETPLFYAARENNMDMIQLLLDHGADPTITDQYGDSAADMTQKAAIKKLLQQTEQRTPVFIQKKKGVS